MASNSIYMKIQADQQGAVQAFMQLTDAQKRAELGLMKIGVAGKKAGRGVKGAGDEGTSAFDVKKLLAYAGGFISITAGIGKVIAAYKEMEAVREKALGGMMESAAAIKPLVQLAQTPEELRRMVGEVEKSRVEAGMPVEAAAKLQFSLESLALQKERPQFAQLYGIADPAAIAEGARTMIEAMGEEEVGTPLQAVNKIFAASQASKTTAEQFAPAATLAGKFFSEIKATDEELLSSLSVMSKQLKSPDIAAQQLGQLADVINVKGFGGKGLWGGVKAIQADVEGMTPEEKKKYFGRKEARLGYTALLGKKTEIHELEERLGVVGAEKPGEDYMTQMLKAAEAQPPLVAERKLRTAREQRKVAEEKAYAIPEAEEDIAVEHARRKTAEEGKGAITRGIRRTFTGMADVLNMGPEAIEKAGEFEWSDIYGGFKKVAGKLLGGPGLHEGFQAITGTEPEGPMPKTVEVLTTQPAGETPTIQPAGEASTSQPAPVVNQHFGDNFYLGERTNMHDPGELAPSVGVD